MSEKGLYNNYLFFFFLDELDGKEAFEKPGSAVRVGDITKMQSLLFISFVVVRTTTVEVCGNLGGKM